MQRVGSGQPDAVHARVARVERSQVGYIAVNEACAKLFQREFDVVFQQVDADEPETGVTHFAYTQPRQFDGVVAHGVVVRGSVLFGDFAHGFSDRFTQTDAYLNRVFRGADAGNELQSAVYFATEVEQDRRTFTLFRREDAFRGIGRSGLAVALKQQIFRSGDQLFVLHPDDAHGRDVGTGSRVELGLFRYIFWKYRR